MSRKYILPAAIMQKADNATIEEVGIGQDVLMERAALAVASKVKSYDPQKVLCICGTGNNGGDALAVARILLMQGVNADVFLCGKPEKYKPAVVKQYDIFQKVGGRTITTTDFTEYDIIVDGIFGIGLERNLEGFYTDIVAYINQAGENKTKIISVDIPSGIHTDTGVVMGCAVKADETVAFAYYKPGHLVYPGAEYCGKVSVEEIGISHLFIEDAYKADTFTMERDILPYLPKRPRNGNKGTFGRVLIVAGSSAMYGACYLSALATLRMGVGLVDIFTHEINRTAVQTMLPEAILHTYEDCNVDLNKLHELMERADCVVIGPGLSTSDIAVDLVKTVLEHCTKPVVADADALNCIAMHKELLQVIKDLKKNVIVTPHPAELSRLTGKSVSELKADYINSVKSFAKEFGLIVVGKDAGTVVSNGEYTYINQTGNSGMATAGSGDVLSGIIGALCAQKESIFDAAWKGVCLHGKAGDLARQQMNSYSLIARDIANALADIMKE